MNVFYPTPLGLQESIFSLLEKVFIHFEIVFCNLNNNTKILTSDERLFWISNQVQNFTFYLAQQNAKFVYKSLFLH